MTGARLLLRLGLTLWLALNAGAVLAQACVSPGARIDVPTPGYLRSATPNLFYQNGGGPQPADLISFTSSRLVIRAPRTGLVPRDRFQIFHLDGTRRRVVANLRTCDVIVTPPPPPPVGPTPVPNQRQAQAIVRPTSDDVVAPSGGPEYALVGSSDAVSRAEGVVIGEGGTILRRRTLGAVGQAILFVDLNGQLTLPDLTATLDSRGIDVSADRHSVYEGAQASSRVYAPTLVGFTDIARCRLPRPVRIGLIDGPVDTALPALSGTRIEVRSALGDRDRPGSPNHGTAVATLIAGNGPELRGMAPGAQLFAVTAFARSGARDVAKMESIATGIDWLLERQVDLVNLSLEGPRNRALARVIGIAADRGLLMVAAAGNAGQRLVAYPASDTSVIAVTAVDAAKRRYVRANTGAEIDFAAPGVDILVPRRRGTGFESGTSFASAIATGLIAYETARGGRQSVDTIRRTLSARAEDLGPVGRDIEFGFGLIRSDGGC